MATEELTEEIIPLPTNRRSVTRYVPAWAIQGYEEYCPLVHEHGHIDTDGYFTFETWEKKGDEFIAVNQSVSDKFCIKNAGFLILEIGHVEEELTVKAAANAIYESVLSLFSSCHDIVRFERIRTSIELSEYLKVYRSNYSHIILIGHGNEDGIKFLNMPNPVRGNELAGLLGADSHQNPIQIISLCCHSGCEENARALSRAEGITEVLAPSGTFDLRWSVHFILGYFLNLYLRGKSLEDSVCDAALDKNSTPMTIWRDGAKTFDCIEKSTDTDEEV